MRLGFEWVVSFGLVSKFQWCCFDGQWCVLLVGDVVLVIASSLNGLWVVGLNGL